MQGCFDKYRHPPGSGMPHFDQRASQSKTPWRKCDPRSPFRGSHRVAATMRQQPSVKHPHDIDEPVAQNHLQARPEWACKSLIPRYALRIARSGSPELRPPTSKHAHVSECFPTRPQRCMPIRAGIVFATTWATLRRLPPPVRETAGVAKAPATSQHQRSSEGGVCVWLGRGS